MKTYLRLFTWAICCLIYVHTYAQSPEYVPGQVIIKMKQGKSVAQKNKLKTRMKADTRRTFSNLNIELWEIDENQQKADIDQLIRQYTNHPDIEYVEPNYIFHLADYTADNNCHELEDIIPTDPLFGNQWNLDNTGQEGGTPNTDINAPEAWDIATGSSAIEVAILDTGVDWDHEDLINNIWQNLGEDIDGDGRVLEFINGEWGFDPDDENGIDDDNSGYADDFIGWDFRDNDNDPTHDLTGNRRWHGTHVAGIVGASGNNGKGISGVAWNVSMPILKIFSGDNEARTSDIIEAIEYATSMNFSVLNNSWGGGPFSMGIRDAMQAAAANGQLLIVAAGNGGLDGVGDNNDNFHNYPSTYEIDNIISVAAIDRNDALADFSNYGTTTVDIAAPGVDILSCFPMNNYDIGNGTSQATPHISAACALLLQQAPNATPAEIKAAIINTATITPALTGKCVSDGRLNLSAALQYIPVSCRERDSLSLVALYNATNGQNWTNTWDLNQPIDGWHGVILDENGCVIELHLQSNQLSGIIPPEIGNLGNLTSLSLSSNQLNGSIPSEIGNLNNLTYLSIKNNQLSGSIPPGIGNLSNLDWLRLNNNQLSGSMPPEIGNLSSLTQLDLHHNQLSGIIPPEIGNLSNLIELDLYQNQLTGNIPPEIGDLSNLMMLYLVGNQLSGSISTEIGNLSNLTELILSDNQLSGSIPPEIGNLSNLTELDLFLNQLTGSIPPEIGNLSNLTELSLRDNQLTGSIPPEIGDLNNLTWLSLYKNQLTGSIPTEIGNLSNLTHLLLYHNQLTGSIPPEIGNLNNLTDLVLLANQLSGSIPSEIGNLSNLNILRLQNNQLSGCYDENLSNLCSQLDPTESINAHISDGNNFDAPWEDFCNTGAGICDPTYSQCRQSDSLALVVLYNSTNGANWTNTWDLSQPMDTWFGVELDGTGCVMGLYLSDNELSNTIPSQLGNLTKLQELWLHNNQLSENIPVEIGNLTSLNGLSLADNQLSGNIPVEFGNLIELQELWLHKNQLSGNIPLEIGNLTNLQSLSLASNNLSGSIPTQFGNLTNLMNLYLHSNQLTGCHDSNLSNICNGLIDYSISFGNNFDTSWEDFCNTGAGTCGPCRQSDSLSLVALYDSTNGANWTNTWNLNQPMDVWYGICLDENGCVIYIDMDGIFNCAGDSGTTPGNNLTGNIPSEIGNLNSLNGLNLDHNAISGSIPPELGNLYNLVDLRLNNNQLSGSIPPELGNLSNLHKLNINHNQLNASIPSEFGSLGNLKYLFLNNNQLSGNIPPELGNLYNLVDLRLNNNQLSSSIPPELGNLNKLITLHLHYNQLSGNIPSELGNLGIKYLLSQFNQLSGNIPPELGNLNNLEILNLENNQLISGTIPVELSNLSNLKTLLLNNNQLSGSIPLELGSLNNLQSLYLFNNQLSGTIPVEIGNLSNLTSLKLQENNLIGNIPSEIGDLNLTYLRLYNNQLSGCYDANLLNLCGQLSDIDAISSGNNFNASWEDFCATGTGGCDVYPGDFNNDGIAIESDMLHWGLAYGFTGSPRISPVIDWIPQTADDWTQNAQGVNGKHQDGDGNGVVNELDIGALTQNFGRERGDVPAPLSLASTLKYDLVRQEIAEGIYYNLYVKDESESYITTHGISLVLNFGDIDIEEVSMDITGSSLQPDNTFEVYDTLQNKFHMALTRTDGLNQFCGGPVAGFVIIAQDIASGDPLEIMRLENGTEIKADGTIQSIANMSIYDTYSGNGVASNDVSVGVSVQHAECGANGSAVASIYGGTPPYTCVWNTGATTLEITDLTAGTYEFTATDADNNTETVSIEVEGQYFLDYDADGNPVDCNMSPCPTLLTPDGVINSGTYQATTTVNSQGTINGSVEFKAGETIILNGGFEVPPGIDFSGTIEDCPDN